MISLSSVFKIFGQTPFRRNVVVVFTAGAICGAWIFGDGAVWVQRVLGSASAPRIVMTAPPMIIENKTLLLSYDASDDIGIREIALRMTPRDFKPGTSIAPVEVVLPAPSAKKISRTDSQNLAIYPWEGKKVTFQIVATNDAGKKTLTNGVDFTLPLRRFFHPVARVLIEERDKLLQNPDSAAAWEEAANIMANIAYQPANYRGDPVVMMALRSGAVRLVLGHDRDAAMSVTEILWQAAVRIEDVFARRASSDVPADSLKNN